MLVAARAAEGLGAAMMAPAAMSLILAIFPEGAERNRALGALGAVGGAGGAIGVLAGGMLTTWLSWRWIFFVNLPVGALIVAGARPLLPESRASLARRRFDVAGAVTVTGGLSVLVYAVVTAASHGWASATTIGLLAGAAALIAAFIVIEARSVAPLLPLGFFRNRTVTVANLAGLLLGGLMFPMFMFLSLYMQQVLGYSAIKAGLAFLVIAGGMIASSALAQGLVTRVGPSWSSLPGCSAWPSPRCCSPACPWPATSPPACCPASCSWLPRSGWPSSATSSPPPPASHPPTRAWLPG